MVSLKILFFFFFFNDTATTEIYTLSLHDALPICFKGAMINGLTGGTVFHDDRRFWPIYERAQALDVPIYIHPTLDRKSTRLNSSHSQISYAVFCLKKKKKKQASCTVTRHVTQPCY